MQILGTPRLIDDDGQVVRDALGNIVQGSVFFTSFNDEQIGVDTNQQLEQSPVAGDWGGIIFRDDLDRAEEDR